MLTLQILNNFFFVLHYSCLFALSGAWISLVALIRCYVFYKYDDFIEFQFTSHKPIRIDRNDKCYSKYEVIGVVKQIIKNL